MTCQAAQRAMIDHDPPPAVVDHIQECAACKARFAAERTLSAALSDLPPEIPPVSPEIERRLSTELSRQMRTRRTRRLLWAAALLAAVSPGLWLALREGHAPPRQVTEAPQPVRLTPFIVLDPLAPDLAAGRGRLVRAQLPASAPAAYGFQIPSESGFVRADVLLAEDGSVHAVRFVY